MDNYKFEKGETMSADKYSAEKLKEFWLYVIEKGLINKQTATSRKIAAEKVLATLDQSERQDLRSLDRDHAFTRFQNIDGKRYNPSSLSVYRSRFNSALDDFLQYSQNPSAFKPNVSRGDKSSGKTTKNRVKESKGDALMTSVPPESQTISDNLTLPIPLRLGVVVKIFGLPSDLTDEEAKKIAGVVSAYAISVKGS